MIAIVVTSSSPPQASLWMAAGLFLFILICCGVFYFLGESQG